LRFVTFFKRKWRWLHLNINIIELLFFNL
jgi:hypothetical protein